MRKERKRKPTIKDKCVDLLRRNPDISTSVLTQKLGCTPRHVQYIRNHYFRRGEGAVNPADVVSDTERFQYEEKIRELEKQLKDKRRKELTEEEIRQTILGLKNTGARMPDWIVNPGPSHGTAGVPTLFLSDWHWGETVDPDQVFGLNQFDLEIAHARAQRVVERTIDLLKNHMVSKDYPGLVLALGGDFISGDIHEELTATNDQPVMPVVLDLYGVLIWAIETLQKEFQRVFIPCVSGNHARITRKIQSKNRGFNNFDWLLYNLLEKHFEGNRSITFQITSGEDLQYKVYNHRYRLTHGDQFRGGDGIIGPLGPVTRGDFKKRTWATQVGLEYETLLLGHFHTFVAMDTIIQNGSLIGYNEFALRGNFKFSRPEQALWMTHPRRGITFRVPVQLEDREEAPDMAWVSIPREAVA
ncbi:MAG: hypothetical protein BWY09_01289 [Candidatus Hydrogenedentes bacterium ADurb.Bin179]|jgi:hypothetical protein|nr:MAG: hypothetical protein BWY09_01289 [Candidatus Hydrogenedentes bacterium ADurb.Bin179]